MTAQQYDACELRRLRKEEAEVAKMLQEHTDATKCGEDKCGCTCAPISVLVKDLLELHAYAVTALREIWVVASATYSSMICPHSFPEFRDIINKYEHLVLGQGSPPVDDYVVVDH